MADEVRDKRLTPARVDLAAAHLRGKVEAARFVEGVAMQIMAPIADVKSRPDKTAPLETQALFGEHVTVFERAKGWAWVQLAEDAYVGYVEESQLGEVGGEPTHWIEARRAPVFSAANVKAPVAAMLPKSARIAVKNAHEKFAELESGGFVSMRHIREISALESDWVAVAEDFLGAPYLWGGCTPDGVDCSGLVQAALRRCGLKCPRDADMQEKALGRALSEDECQTLRRGDLVFWKGHAGLMTEALTLLHANAFHMACVVEPFAEAVKRIAQAGLEISSIRRLGE
jgi:cell wall-associated NlpC family hydrolase